MKHGAVGLKHRTVNQQVVISDDRRCKTGWVFTQPVFYAID